jgi:hypothetical protein
MKTSASHLWLFLGLSLGLLATPGMAATRVAPEPTVKVQVNVPPTWQQLPNDHFPEWFAASLGNALSRDGFRVPLTQLRSMEDPKQAPYLLKIDVRDWHVTPEGDMSCTFVATLRTPDGEQRLGEYSDTRWIPGVIYGSSPHAYYPKSDAPITLLSRDLLKSGLFSSPTA